MSTITREWLQQKIADMEATRDEIPFGLDEDDSNTLAALRIALASLEAEAVAWDYEWASYITCEGPQDFKRVIEREAPPEWAIDEGQARNITPLYTAPPAPVVPDEWEQWIADVVEYLEGGLEADGELEAEGSIEAKRLLSRHAAMLQGADQPQSAQQNIQENIPTLREAVDTIRSSDIAIDGEKILAERDALNSPVIPDGWALVPIEPTEHMIVEGFESEPGEFFSDEEVWEAYDAMSGCQQAAHRAKLCWAAMIEAAPKLE